MELTKIQGTTKVSEYTAIQNANMDTIASHASTVDEALSTHSTDIEKLQATCLYIDDEGYICLKEE